MAKMVKRSRIQEMCRSQDFLELTVVENYSELTNFLVSGHSVVLFIAIVNIREAVELNVFEFSMSHLNGCLG